MKEDQKCNNKKNWGAFASPGHHSVENALFTLLKQVQNSEFVYYASKRGKCIKQTPTPPFWGDVGVKKWSQFLDLGTQSPIFGNLKMGTFGI